MSALPEEYENSNVAIPELPDIERQAFEQLELGWKKATSIVSILVSLIPHMVAFFILFFAAETKEVWIWALVHGIFLAITLFVGVYPSIAYPKIGYLLRTHDITYRKGLIWRKEVTITYNRIQHLEVSQGPIEKLFDLSSLQLFTAGGQKSDMEISGLHPDTAKKIKDWVAKKAEVDL